MNVPTGSEIAAFLAKPISAESQIIKKPADLAECGDGDIVWVKSFSPERLALLEERRPSLAICDPETSAKTTVPNIASDRPRLDFIRVVTRFFVPETKPAVHPTAIVDPTAALGERVSLGAYACIGPEVTLGDDCVIGSGVVIEGRVRLGKRCVIKANSVIGAPGFGFEYDESGRPFHFPHLGKVVLEDDVWIGACSTVERAALGTTRICARSKIDDLVQVGHNVTVGSDTLVCANSVTCGGAKIGRGCWLAPNSVIKEKVNVGDGVTVGLGAVVIRDIPDGLVVAGVPAKPLPG